MIKKIFFTLFTVSLIAAAAFFVYEGTTSRSVGIFKNNNPYTRKPASTGLGKVIDDRESDKSKVFDLENKLNYMDELYNCYTQNCYDFSSQPSVFNKIVRDELLTFYERTLKNEIYHTAIVNVAIRFLSTPDMQVKEASLLLLGTQRTEQRSLEAIVKHVLYAHNTNLVGLALMELEKYKSSEYRETISKSFIKSFSSGSSLARQVLAKGIYRFVSEETKSDYIGLLKSLPKGSRIRKTLKASLDRYERSTNL